MAEFERALRRVREMVRSAAYLRKWVVLGAVIGLIAGVGAALFFVALQQATQLFLGLIAGFVPATPTGEGGAPIADAARPWAIPLVVGLGGLLSGLIVFRLAPEAEGHGTDAAIDAFHHHPRGIRARIPLVKLVASAITIGSGGSGGREGPTAQIGAGFGSLLARALDLDARDARIAVSSGMAAGIGAIFRAPLGGAVLGAEIPYREDVEAEALVPSFVASVVAFSIFGLVIGFAPIFGRVSNAGFDDPRQLVYYAGIGLLAGAVGRAYIFAFYGLSDWFRGWSLPRWARPAIAGVVVGLIGMAIPGVLGTGYGWVQAGFDRDALLALPLWMIVALPFAKILATGLSIGSGGSGGIFGPGMVIGGLLGATVWRLLEPVAPAVPLDPAPFVIVAMMALFGSVAHAPLAVMLMVAEMTGNLAMLAPAMIAIGIATVVVGDRSIYASQLRSRADSPAHRWRVAMPLMASISAGAAARVPRLTLRDTDTAGRGLARLLAADLPGAPVVGGGHELRGTVTRDRLASADAATALSQLIDAEAPALAADDGLDDALGMLNDHHLGWAPVTNGGQLIGVLSTGDAMQAYRRALAGNVRQVRRMGGGSIVEARLGARSPIAGQSVSEAAWPRSVVLVAIQRDDELVIPRGDTRLEVGDVVSVFSAGGQDDEALRIVLEGDHPVNE